MKKTFVGLLDHGLAAADAVRLLLKSGFPVNGLKLARLNAEQIPPFGNADCGELEYLHEASHIVDFLRNAAAGHDLLQLHTGRPLTLEEIGQLLNALENGAWLLIVQAGLDQLGFIQQMVRDSAAEAAPAIADDQAMSKAMVHYLVGRRSQAPGSTYVLSPEERQRMVAEAAYFKAQARGFGEEGQLDDWLAAEREIQHKLEHAGKPAGTAQTVLMPSPRARSLGMAERRVQPQGHHEPERRSSCALVKPAAGGK